MPVIQSKHGDTCRIHRDDALWWQPKQATKQSANDTPVTYHWKTASRWVASTR